MKKIIIVLALLYSASTFGQVKEGTFVTLKGTLKRDRVFIELLRTKIINDSTFIFSFHNDDTIGLSFNEDVYFGIAHITKDKKWIGVMDFSSADRNMGEFTVKQKQDSLGFSTMLEFDFKNELVNVTVIESNIRGYTGALYSRLDSIPLSYYIKDNYKNLGFVFYEYTVNQTTPLYFLPEKLLQKRETITKGEIVCVENEYKEFVFVVKYDKNKRVIKSGWVRRDAITFLKEEKYTR